MARYIDADKMLANICAECLDKGTDECKNGNCTERNWIYNTQTEDVQPVVHSKWEISSDGYYPYCKRCKTRPSEMTKYCPECGARKDEK